MRREICQRRRVLLGLAALLLVYSGFAAASSTPVAAYPWTGTLTPLRPGALLAGRGGRLYIADDGRNQILERLPNGTFRVFAGTGKAGFSGDGGPATRAEIDDPGGMALGPDGTVYFADQRNDRVRAIAPNGTISTIAGGGKGNAPWDWVKTGTPALSAQLTPAAVTMGPRERLYMTSGNEVLRLERNGTLTRIAGNIPHRGLCMFDSGHPARNQTVGEPDGLAFDRAGNLYLAGWACKILRMITAAGVMKLPDGMHSFYPPTAGVAAAPDGSVIGVNHLSIERLGPDGVTTIYNFVGHHVPGVGGVFEPNGIAVAPNGTIFTDTDAGNGYSSTGALIAISPSRHVRVLWDPSP